MEESAYEIVKEVYTYISIPEGQEKKTLTSDNLAYIAGLVKALLTTYGTGPVQSTGKLSDKIKDKFGV